MSISGHANGQNISSFNSRPSVKQSKNCSTILSNALVSKEASSAVVLFMFQWRQLRVQFRTLPQTPVLWSSQMACSMAAQLQMPMCMFCRKVIMILLEIFGSNWTIQVLFSRINVRLYVVSLDSEFLWFLLVVIANQRRSFLGLNQSDCEKVIDNACSFFVSRSWSRSENNIFFGEALALILW